MEKLILQIVVGLLFICVIALYWNNKRSKKYGIFDTINVLKKQGYSDEQILDFTNYLCILYATLAPDRIKAMGRKIKSLDPEILMNVAKFKQAIEEK